MCLGFLCGPAQERCEGSSTGGGSCSAAFACWPENNSGPSWTLPRAWGDELVPEAKQHLSVKALFVYRSFFSMGFYIQMGWLLIPLPGQAATWFPALLCPHGPTSAPPRAQVS